MENGAARLESSDEQLMWRVKLQEDSEAFARLVKRWRKPIESLCAHMTGDSHKAEDLAQLVFCRIFGSRSTWEPRSKFSTFIWQVALNLCRDEARRGARRSECSIETLARTDECPIEVLEDSRPWPDAAASLQERTMATRLALQRLSPIHREVVVLRHYQGLKFSEIAQVLGIPEGTAKSRMAEALTQLRRHLKQLDSL
jgi:RNA polymerase sigma-70 factor, ECF subfamily